ncbi:SRPBCC family protein [Rhodococcus sp. IEGM 1379]|uniref:SRPBCC family protein n=1 Tax=Rhodococcus sp. IEGM 1379 TaxID=3047086 RepID=UPI0024B84098|nr:SRPBCC family protein [Rhodococcus sp. IEGM 1379]MDI9917221.1 SRPBCC family protein [Rhodococcus sp. IEGM 1379]
MNRASAYIEATPSEVWAVISDLEGMGRFSPENTGGKWTSGKPGTVGATFKGTNKHGLVRWTTRCTVAEVVDGQKFSFEVDDSKARWTFLVEPSDTGTLLTETREIFAKTSPYVRVVSGSGLLGRNRDQLMQSGIETTLTRIKEHLEK